MVLGTYYTKKINSRGSRLCTVSLYSRLRIKVFKPLRRKSFKQARCMFTHQSQYILSQHLIEEGMVCDGKLLHLLHKNDCKFKQNVV